MDKLFTREKLLSNDVIVGATSVIVGLLFIVILNPILIDIPSDEASFQAALGPDSFPDLCAWLCVAFGGLTLWNGLRNPVPEEKQPFDKRAFITRVLAFVTLFGLYYVVDFLGIIIAGFIFFLLFAWFCGEQRWLRSIIIAAILTVILYFFFVYVALCPMPLGLLNGLLH